MYTFIFMCFFSLSTSSMVDLTWRKAGRSKLRQKAIKKKKTTVFFHSLRSVVTQNVTIYMFLFYWWSSWLSWRYADDDHVRNARWLVFFFLIFEHTQNLAVSAESWTFFEWSCVCGVVSEFFWEEKHKDIANDLLLVFCDAAYYGDLVMVLYWKSNDLLTTHHIVY